MQEALLIFRASIPENMLHLNDIYCKQREHNGNLTITSMKSVEMIKINVIIIGKLFIESLFFKHIMVLVCHISC